MNVAAKPVVWLGKPRNELSNFPRQARLQLGFARRWAESTATQRLFGVFGGAGVLEVVVNHAGNTFRRVYTVRFAGAVYVLHVFQKKSKHGIATPKSEIDLVKERLRWAESDYENRRKEKDQG